MVKSAAAVREEKQDVPAKVTNKASKPGSALANTPSGNPITGMFERSSNFLKDVRGEMRKVVTPSKEEVRSTTAVVIATVFAFAAYFYVVDGVLGRVVQTILRWLGGAQ